jgi:hypothetical protein
VNLSARSLAVVILSTNDWLVLQRGAPAILRALQGARLGSFHEVAVGGFRRKPIRSFSKKVCAIG